MHRTRPFNSAFSRRAVIVLSLLCLLVLPVILLTPLHADIDIYQSMAFQLYRFHSLPYISSWDQNFPGIVFIQAGGIALFGNSEIGFRTMDYLVQALTLIAFYRVSRLWLGEGSALLASVLYALIYAFGPGMVMGQRDCFAVLPLVLGTGAMAMGFRSKSGRSRNMFVIAGGTLYAIATLIRPTFALMIVMPYISLFDLRKAEGRKAFVTGVIGFVIPVGLCMIPYLLTPHGLSEAYLATIRYNNEVYRNHFHFRDSSKRAWIALIFCIGWGLAMLRHRMNGRPFQESPRSPNEKRFLIFSIASLLIGVIVMRRLASYHFVPFFAFCIPVLSSILWEWKARFGKWGRVYIALLVLAAFVMFYPFWLAVPFIGSVLHLPNASAVQLGPEIDVSVASYIEKNTTANDSVEVASYTSPGVHWRIERPSATRFTTIQQLMAIGSLGTYTNFQQRWRAEYVHQLEQVKPKYYVIDNSMDLENNIPTMTELMRLDGFPALIENDYRIDTTIGNYVIYGRK